jgi:hypothetical protein
MNYKCMGIDILPTSIEVGRAKLKLLLRDDTHPDPTSQPLLIFALLLIVRNFI